MNNMNLLNAKTIYTYKVNVTKKTIKCLIDLYENNNHIIIKTKLTFDEFLNLVQNGYIPLGFNIEPNGFLNIKRSQLRPYFRAINNYVKKYKKHWSRLKSLDENNKENYYK